MIRTAILAIVPLITCVLKSSASSPLECMLRQFTCVNKKCVPLLWMCDGHDDCGDNSDETDITCLEKRECNETEFKCDSGQCIKSEWLCDREKDCRDGSDEEPKNCKKINCWKGDFECSPNVCIPARWVCDGNEDCPLGEDECNCKMPLCAPNEFQCGDGKCIPQRRVCDTLNDCMDHADEKNCPPTTCRDNEFSCDNGRCIPDQWACDGNDDCIDASDEKDCKYNITHGSICSPYQFTCADRISCLDSSLVCNEKEDCPDGSDELPSLCCPLDCTRENLKCQGHRCHCYDPNNTSVLNIKCANPLYRCQPHEFPCEHNICLPQSKLCDGISDCPNGEDESEIKCRINECEVDNGGCQHLCVDAPIGYSCKCEPGYKLSNTTHCVDINECELPGSCSQTCTNLEGSFLCSCKGGYTMSETDHTKCLLQGPPVNILLTKKTTVEELFLHIEQIKTIVNNSNSAMAFDYDYYTGSLFWNDNVDRNIYKGSILHTEPTIVLVHNVTKSYGLAVDWITGNVYWTDAGSKSIGVINRKGYFFKTLISEDLDEPRDITINPSDGWMYWTDWGKTPKIERAGMDGTARQILVYYEIVWPNGLTLDLVQERLYWVDAKLHLISSINFDGSGRRVILKSNDLVEHPFSIGIIGDDMYWSDWSKNMIFKANKFTGANVTEVAPNMVTGTLLSIKVFHPYRQPISSNPCHLNNAGCSHLCLLSPVEPQSTSAKCSCPDNWTLMNDHKRCTRRGVLDKNNQGGFDWQPAIPTPVIIDHEEELYIEMKQPVFIIFGSFMVCLTFWAIYKYSLKLKRTRINFQETELIKCPASEILISDRPHGPSITTAQADDQPLFKYNAQETVK